ncbi:MAG: isoleucine--tRNA ligase, partial [Cyclobacteriaceae bacterium]|nr:isoleucine--tRNA ligase [Cyclobacteriaceae bacterium]
MSKYKEFKDLNLAQVATEVLAFWKEEKIFEKSVSNREGAPSFTFYEGPPSANGTPGIHHVMARTVKDIFCRFKTLQGFQVNRKGGWDTHGLPVELQVEKELGITKDDIGKKISVEEYNQKCRETVMKYKDQWDDLTLKMGYWVDLEKPYITYEKEYIESLWWILKQLYDKKLLYKGYTIQPYSPAAGTGLSSHELNLPGCYKDVKDTSIVAQFKVTRNAKSEFLFKSTEKNIFILAWTTTPWTLPSNTALAVGEKITYVEVDTFNSYTHKPISVVLAKALVGKYFSDKNKDLKLEEYKAGDKNIPFQIVQEFTGKNLVGIRYEQLMPYLQPFYDADKAFQVIAGDFVTTEDGTGVVHTSPTFGADDFKVAKQNGIPALTIKDELDNEVPTVDRKGKFISVIGKHLAEGVKKFNIKTHKPLGADDFYVKNYTNEDESNSDYKNTDVIISIILKEENKAFKVEKYEHTYPHCWRTDKPILYYPLDSWFIKTTALKDRMVELNKTINWKPESTGTGRFGNWLENLVDWNLSRSRYWGTPLPIWRTKDGKEEICIGSIEQLTNEVEKARNAGITNSTFDIRNSSFDLHRPYVDEIVLVSASGQPMYRELDLIDVWFDSGAMPYAQWHYPFENKEIFEKNYPADFIAEGVDQTRGWFFTLHAIAVMLSDSSD